MNRNDQYLRALGFPLLDQSSANSYGRNPSQILTAGPAPSLRERLQGLLAESQFGEGYGRSGYRTAGRQLDAASAVMPLLDVGLLSHEAGYKGADAYQRGELADGAYAGGLLSMAALGLPGIRQGANAIRKANPNALDRTPQHLGAGMDRTDYTMRRFSAPKGTSARAKRLLARLDSDKSLSEGMLDIARDGEDVGRVWYNTDPTYKRFVDELGPIDGDAAFKEYIGLVGATSTGSKVPPNIRNASWYFTENGQNRMFDDPQIQSQLKSGDYLPPKGSGYGHKMQKNQAANVGKFYSGEWGADADPRLNPKPRGFMNSLLGGQRNIAADKHFTRLLAMISDDPDFLHGSAEIGQGFAQELRDKFGKDIDPYIKTRMAAGKPAINFNAKKAVREGPPGLYNYIKNNAQVWEDMPNDNEYDAFEFMANQLGDRLNMNGPQFQASLWMGGAKQTGVDPSSLDTFSNLFEQNLNIRAKERGLTPDEVFRQFVKRQAPLAVPGAIGVGAGVSGLLGYEPSEDEKIY